MLPPANRLRKEKEIKRVLAGRIGYKGGMLVCKTALNGLNTARFCFIVSKRISNKAVIRNRLKRQMREIVRSILPDIAIGFDYVLIACPGLEKKDYNGLLLAVKKGLDGLVCAWGRGHK